jgi:selenide,water dikinase
LLAEALASLPKSNHPDLLVGFNKADDAGVYKISDNLALVQTVDFFPPIVDDPYWFGAIAAANALSDVYAMGGTPLTALNIVGFPSNLPTEVLTEILRGGNDKITEAGAVVVGGHSIKDSEPKFGVSITGRVHPDRILTNSGARVGDLLFLTKPLGTGIITTGIKNNKVDDELIEKVTIQMATLNKSAAEAMVASGAHAATDVTGYGLLGHAYEMADGSGVTIAIDSSKLPIIDGALELARDRMIPGGLGANRIWLDGKVSIAEAIPQEIADVMHDPQTSGGLLIALPADKKEVFITAMSGVGLAAEIGRVIQQTDTAVVVS